MNCPQCGAPNRPAAKFCAGCGRVLDRACPTCAAAVRPAQRFCDECGTELGRPPAPVAATPVAERRVCSVLFCDLVGFTPLSADRDPEEVRELLSDYFELARTVIERYGGLVEKFIGDAVMAVWGTPLAVEGDAERAVRAGLDLVEAVSALGQRVGAPGLAARAGAVTGTVAVTLGATGQGMVAGDAVNTAARVQGAAEPGTVLVDEGTWRVARAAVAFAPAGEHQLKGKAERVALWRAERVLSGVGGARRADGLEAPFVGHHPELRLVKDLYHATVQRRTPRLVSVTGAPGVGKTRLAWEFEKYVDGLAEPVWWHRGRCLSYGDGVAFWALAEMLRGRLGIAEDDSPPVAAAKLAEGLDRFLPDAKERAYVEPRLGQLLGTGPAGGSTLGREELFAGWRLCLERLAAYRPVILVVEDLHHADPDLLDFLEHVLDWAAHVPIFVLTLARTELEARRAGWGTGRRNATALTLGPLEDAAMAELLDGLVPGLPAAARAAVVAAAEGIPLYAVESVRMLIDRGVVSELDGSYRLVGDVGQLGVPETLQSLLASRLDALPADARRLVADAAVLGGSFPGEALVAVSGLPNADVQRLLGELVRREVLSVRADPLSPERGQYGFVQAMFRQVAYQTLSRRERKSRHLRVAAYLQDAFAEQGEPVAEMVAAHLLDAVVAVPDDPDAGQLRQRAAEELARGGERAERTGAPASAAALFDSAADLLERAAGTAEEALAAAALRERAGVALAVAGDLASAAAQQRHAAQAYRAHGRARDAARADTRTGSALRRLGRHEEARPLLQAALAALREPADADTVGALDELAALEIFAGAPEGDQLAATALAEAQALDLPDGVLAKLFSTAGIGHLIAGRIAQAAAYFREAIHRAEAAQDPAVAAPALLNLADVLVTSDPAAAAEAARSAVAYCRRTGEAIRLAAAGNNLAQALLYTGEWDEAAAVFGPGGQEEDPALAWSGVLLGALRGDEELLARLLPVVEKWTDTEDPQDLAEGATALAAAAAYAGDHGRASAEARRALAQEGALGLRHDGIRWAWPLAADAALATGDEAAAAELVGWLEGSPPGHRPAVLRAELLRVRARLRGGEPAYTMAIAGLRDLGSPYHLAVGLLDAAEYGAGPDARLLVTEATAYAERLAAKPLLARAARLAANPGLLP